MAEIGVRELKTRASQILKEVRDHRARYTVTYRGRPIGVLMPLAEAPDQPAGASDAWEDLARVGEQISKGWTAPQTSSELLSDMRR